MESVKLKKSRRPTEGYSEEFKRKVCEEYLQLRCKKTDLLRKYDIKFRSAIQTWLRNFGYSSASVYHVYPTDALQLMGRAKEEKDVSALERQIVELKQKLANAELKGLVLEKLIDVAERDLHIDIRKKRNTKQSKK
jgi:transposase-like protein